MSLTDHPNPPSADHARPRLSEKVETTTASTVTLKSRRTVYGRSGTPTSLGMWMFQRVSGVLLGPLVIVHVLVPSAPMIRWLSAVLLAIILGHAFVGLWRLAAMRRISLPIARSGLALSVLYIVVIAVFGIGLICSL